MNPDFVTGFLILEIKFRLTPTSRTLLVFRLAKRIDMNSL
jgi:hypothetical protein